MQTLLLLWKRVESYKFSIILAIILETMFSLLKTFIPILIWIPISNIVFDQQKNNAIVAVFTLLFLYYLFSVIERALSSYRIKLSILLNQDIKSQLSEVAMTVKYEQYMQGELIGKLQQANDILSLEFDYSEGIDLIVTVLKNIVYLISSFSLLLVLVFSKGKTGLFNVAFESSFWGQISYFLLLFLPLCLSIYLSSRKKQALKNKLHKSMEKHIEIEKHFSYYVNEIVYRFDLYPLISIFNYRPLIANKMRENSKENCLFFEGTRNLSINNMVFSNSLSLINAMIIFALVSYKFYIAAISKYMFITYFESVQLFFSSIFNSFEAWNQFKVSAVYLENIENLLAIVREEKPLSQTKLAKNKTAVDNNFSGWVFDNVSYQYPNTDSYAIKDLSFHLDKNGIHVLVGKNGSGKTTLILLLSKLIQPCSGEIYYQGKKLADWSDEEYFEQIGCYFQNSSLFPLSLLENIDKSDIEDEAISKELMDWGFDSNQISLWQASEDLLDLNLSGGERSKLLILRAILSNKNSLFLDEPSAALDAESEATLYDKIRAAKQLERMILFVSHRLSSVKYADDILVLDNGSLVARGSHQELIKNSAIYSQLWHSQKNLSQVPDLMNYSK